MDLLEELFASGHVQKAQIGRYLHTSPADLPLNGSRIVFTGLRQNLGKCAVNTQNRNVKAHGDT